MGSYSQLPLLVLRTGAPTEAPHTFTFTYDSDDPAYSQETIKLLKAAQDAVQKDMNKRALCKKVRNKMKPRPTFLEESSSDDQRRPPAAPSRRRAPRFREESSSESDGDTITLRTRATRLSRPKAHRGNVLLPPISETSAVASLFETVGPDIAMLILMTMIPKGGQADMGEEQKHAMCASIRNFMIVVPKAQRAQSTGGSDMAFNQEQAYRKIVFALGILPTDESVTTYRCRTYETWGGILAAWCDSIHGLDTPFSEDMKEEEDDDDEEEDPVWHEARQKFVKCTTKYNLGYEDFRLFHIYNYSNMDRIADLVSMYREYTGMYALEGTSSQEREDELDTEWVIEIMYMEEVYYEYEEIGKHLAVGMLLYNMVSSGMYKLQTPNKTLKDILSKQQLLSLLESETCGQERQEHTGPRFKDHWMYKEMYGFGESSDGDEESAFMTFIDRKYGENYRQLVDENDLSDSDYTNWQPWEENWLKYEMPDKEQWQRIATSSWNTKGKMWKMKAVGM